MKWPRCHTKRDAVPDWVRRILLALSLLSVSAHARPNTDNFFRSDKVYLLQITHWNPAIATPATLSKIYEDVSYKGAQIDLYEIDSSSTDACEVNSKTRLHHSEKFEIEMTGQSTQMVPKSSYKFKMKDSTYLSMKALNLKGMWYDPSQMREAFAWNLFRDSGVLALGQAYVRLCIEAEGKNSYFGLYSAIEHPDESFARRKFQNAKGNYYSANYKAEDIGAANLAYLGDQGKNYFLHPYVSERSYQLKNFSELPENGTYQDLATLIRITNGRDYSENPPKSYFESDEYRKRLERVFDVQGFIKWAAVSRLLGAWDNYWCSPQNYALYNEGTIESPYFHWVPWDYDAVLGSRSLNWANADIFDWEASTSGCGGMYNLPREEKADIPLIRNVLSNPVYRTQYVSFLGEVLEKRFTETRFAAEQQRIWKMIRVSVFLEEEHNTGRRYINSDIERHITDENYVIDTLGEPYFHILKFVRESIKSVEAQINE